MSLKIRCILLGAAALSSAACAGRPSRTAAELVLDGESRQVSGWFSARGEWTLHPNRNSKRYNPYVTNENSKCVSVVNGTGRPRLEFARFDGRRVVVRGYAADYDKLADGETAADKLLSKKYVGREVVENFCLRQFVFVATDLRE